MGVMTEKDYVIAALNNLKEWDFDVKAAYPMQKEEAQAVIKVLEMHKAKEMMKELHKC